MPCDAKSVPFEPIVRHSRASCLIRTRRGLISHHFLFLSTFLLYFILLTATNRTEKAAWSVGWTLLWTLSRNAVQCATTTDVISQQPALLAGNPPSDDFSSLLSTCVKCEEISTMKTEKIEPLITTSVQACKLQDGDAEALHPRTSHEFHELENARVSIPRQRSESAKHCWSDVR